MLKVSGPAEKYVIALLHLMLYVFNSLKTALCESVCDSLQKKKKKKKCYLYCDLKVSWQCDTYWACFIFVSYSLLAWCVS